MNELAAQKILEATLALGITRAMEVRAGSDRAQRGRLHGYVAVLSWAKLQAEQLGVRFADPAITALEPYDLLSPGARLAFNRGPEPSIGARGAYVVLEEVLERALDDAREARGNMADPHQAGVLAACHELLAFALGQARERGLAFGDGNLANLDPDELRGPDKQAA